MSKQRSAVYSCIALSLVIGLASCQTMQQNPRTTTGAAVGAAAGAGIGAAVDDDKRWRGALIGAAAGSLLGGGIGQALDRQQRAYERIEGLEAERTSVQFPGQDEPQAALQLRMSSEVLFAKDSAALTSGGREKVAQVADVMRQYPNSEVLIRGYASSEGEESYNLRLSERRAESVRMELIANGVSSARLTAQGFGEANPIGSNETESGRAMNRRVEITVVPTG